MDIVSAVFATLLGAVSSSIGDTLIDQLNQVEQSKVVQYEGFEISYSYQMWRIKDKTVCDNYSQNLSDKSYCAQAAKRMFRDMCSYLQNNPQSSPKYVRVTNMYCNAATNFKPLIATVSLDEAHQKDDAQRACSVAILKAMENPTNSNVLARKKACSDAD